MQYCPGSDKCPAELRTNPNGQSKQHMLIMPDAPFRILNTGSSAWQYSIPPWNCANGESCESVRATLMDMGSSYFYNWNGDNALSLAGGFTIDIISKNTYFTTIMPMKLKFWIVLRHLSKFQMISLQATTGSMRQLMLKLVINLIPGLL